MPRRDDSILLRHMLDASLKAVSFVNGKSRGDFDCDEQLGLATIRLLEIIGEAANGISDDCKKKHPEMPWLSIVGTRNRLIHGYFDVDGDIVWNIVTQDLPPLIPKLQLILRELNSR